MVERLCESAVEVGQEVISAAKNEHRWYPVAKQMVHAWNDGMASLRSLPGNGIARGTTRPERCQTRKGAPQRKKPKTKFSAFWRSSEDSDLRPQNLNLERETRLELATSTLARLRSTS